jgi:hypothetical protein
VGNPNSPKKLPRSSARSERTTSTAQETSSHPQVSDFDDEQYLERSLDLVARVRTAKEAAQRKMDEFGDPSEYEVSIIQGQKRLDLEETSQTVLNFEPDAKGDAD